MGKEKVKKPKRFRNWFFKGRIEKSKKSSGRIESLSEEYDNGKVLRLVNNG